MTLFNDLWKKFTKPLPLEQSGKASVNVDGELKENRGQGKTEDASLDITSDITSSTFLKNAESVLNAFEHSETEERQATSIKKNLKALQEVVNQPKINLSDTSTDHQSKNAALEMRFTKISQHLGQPEVHETVRMERWQPNIHCPDCSSGNLKRLMQVPPHSPFKHRYRCLECGLIFNDDSETPFERSVPNINIWMQCWYLMGCTESLSYIASKLGLDLSVVEYMAEQLRLIFKTNHPLTRFVDYDEWSKQSKHLRDQLKEDLLKQYERLSADIATIPKDTAEFRRQQNLRRDLVSTTAPPSGGRKR